MFVAADQNDTKAVEIASAWNVLEANGFPPEAAGWPVESIEGRLPEAIDAAIECLVRQRNDLLAEVTQLRTHTGVMRAD